MRRGAVDQWNILEIQNQHAGCLPHTLEDSQHTRSGAEEECAANSIDHDVAIGRLLGIVPWPFVSAVGNVVERPLPTIDLNGFRHPMQEQ